MTELPTEPIREEHRQLAPHLGHIESAAVEVTRWTVEQAARRLPPILGFLRDDLLPHARTEEDLLYPEIDRIQGAATCDTMKVDHLAIGERIDLLDTTVDKALTDWDDPALVSEVSRQLAAISAIVSLHFRKEEEVLLPILDSGITVEEGHALFERMGHSGHAHAHAHAL